MFPEGRVKTDAVLAQEEAEDRRKGEEEQKENADKLNKLLQLNQDPSSQKSNNSGGKKEKNGDKALTLDEFKKIQSILANAEFITLEFQYGKHLISKTGVMLIKTSNGVIKIATSASKYSNLIKTLEGAGYLGNFLDLGMNIYQYNLYKKNKYDPEGISGNRFAYRVGGAAASMVSPIIYGAIAGSAATPVVGTVIGIVVGACFQMGEVFYDSYPKAINHFEALINYLNRVEGALRNFGYKK